MRRALLALLVLMLEMPVHAEPALVLDQKELTPASSEPGEPKVPMQTSQKPDEAAMPSSAVLPSCSSITDGLCDNLWGGKSRGNLKVFDGGILRGRSRESGFSLTVLQDYRALVESAPRLPKDVAASLGPWLRKLKAALDKEDSTKAWKRKVSDIQREIGRALQDVQEERVSKRFPEMAKKAKYDVQDLVNDKRVMDEIRDEILDAKYKSHENWKRVESVFEEARNDILAEIATLPIAPEERRKMADRVAKVSLSLPYVQSGKIGAEEDCGMTTMNAFYHRPTNQLTACAGYFNAFQSDSILYGTIAHEIGHSIDPINLARHRCEDHSPVGKALKPLDGAKAPPYSCEDWKSLLNATLKEKPVISRKESPLDALYDCLEGKNRLEKFTTESVRAASKQIARSSISSYATDNSFLSMVVPVFREFGEEKKNEIYLRPDLWYAKTYREFKRPQGLNSVNAQEIFAQSLACQREASQGRAVGFSEAAGAPRQAMFGRAISETREVLRARDEDWFSYCGQNCAELVPYGLAANPQENFADWISFKALRHRLRRIGDRDPRREASALFAADMCSYPDFSGAAPDLAEHERKYSARPHPTARLRRVSAYTQENSELVACQRDKESEGYSSCEP